MVYWVQHDAKEIGKRSILFLLDLNFEWLALVYEKRRVCVTFLLAINGRKPYRFFSLLLRYFPSAAVVLFLPVFTLQFGS